jgi:hypothetical protein
MRTPEQALAYARRFTTNRVGMCLWHVQDWFGSPHVYPDAYSQAKALHLYPGTPPPGVPVFYGPGSGSRYGHVAISTGGGRIRSTDCPGEGRVGETDLNWPQRRWGHPYIGWARNIGGVDIPGAPMPGQAPAPAPASGGDYGPVYIGKLHQGQTDSDSVKALQRALNAHSLPAPGNITLPVTGNFAEKTAMVVQTCQRVHGSQWGEGAADPDGKVSVGPKQAAHLGLHVVG